GIFHRERYRINDPSGRELEPPVPPREAVAAPHARASPRDTIAVRPFERRGPVRRDRANDVEVAEDVDTLEEPGTDDATEDADGSGGASFGPHRQTVDAQLDVDALRRGRRIAATLADRVEDGIARESLREHARESTVRSERRGAWMAGARTALVPVR